MTTSKLIAALEKERDLIQKRADALFEIGARAGDLEYTCKEVIECPICGKAPESEWNRMIGLHSVFCDRPNLITGYSPHLVIASAASRAAAVKRWNTRAIIIAPG